MKILYVIDYSNVVYKLKNTYNLSVNIGGVDIHTSVLYGFLRLLKSNTIASDIVVCLDGYPEQSMRVLPEYKGTRSHESDPKIYVPKGELIRFLTKIGERIGKNVTVLAALGEEADQVISSVCHMALGQMPVRARLYMNSHSKQVKEDPYLRKHVEGSVEEMWTCERYDRVVVSTTDSDMYQLKHLGPVFLDASTNGKRIIYEDTTPKAVDYIKPECIAIYKAFIGDHSDNVPSIIPSRLKSKLRQALEYYVTSKDDVNHLLRCFRLGKCVPDVFKPFYELLQENKTLKTLLRNYEVTDLHFFSVPHKLYFPDYVLDSTLESYKIKV